MAAMGNEAAPRSPKTRQGAFQGPVHKDALRERDALRTLQRETFTRGDSRF